MSTKLSLSAVNQLAFPDFVQHFGSIFEHSRWIAEQAYVLRPFASLLDLHQKMVALVRQAPAAQQLQLLQAHPDLAGRLAQQGQLTAESAREQASAGLDQLDSAQVHDLTVQNEAYQQRFGFPFIICARLNSLPTILEALQKRLTNNRTDEMTTALEEIAKIAKLRLEDKIV
jgi:2-oxo-4-hydroxy-4-carboxy-5-ureidoimidazoline decarboxylase